MKKFLTNVLAFTMLASIACGATACGTEIIEDIETDKTQLYVASYTGGVGYQFLDGAVERFEAQYAETSFEEGKKGVQVIVDPSKSYTGDGLSSNLLNASCDVYFVNAFKYYEGVAQGLVMDITDLVTETKNAQDGKTIYSKLSAQNQEALKIDGKYYVIPYAEIFDGISYDAGVFTTKNLYFADKLDTSDTTYPNTNAFVKSATEKKSCGPDGKYDTYDDGLPSSYHEFYKMMDKMIKSGVTPFVFTGSSVHYTNKLIKAFYTNYIGAEGVSVNYDYDSNGEEIEIVTDWNGDEPVVTNMALTKNNANKIKSSLGLYYASELVAKVFGDTRYYSSDSSSTTFSNLDAMEKFMKSGLDGEKPVAMLIDGDYWYDEAVVDGIIEDTKNTFPATYTQKDVRFMALPQQYEGRVTENNGGAPVLVSDFNSYAFIHAKTPANRIEVAKLFLSFCYGDEELKEAAKVCNGITKGVLYDVDSVYDSLDSYGRSVLQMRSAAVEANTFVTAASTDPIFKYNQAYFSFVSTSDYWACISPATNTRYADPYNAFSGSHPLTVKDYFQGLEISDSVWNSTYNKNYD